MESKKDRPVVVEEELAVKVWQVAAFCQESGDVLAGGEFSCVTHLRPREEADQLYERLSELYPKANVRVQELWRKVNTSRWEILL